MIQVISIRQQPKYAQEAIKFLQSSWPDVLPIIYEDCIMNCLHAEQDLPQWYLLKKQEQIIGCAGLISNDFISRMDLYPWLCALFIAEQERGHQYASRLIDACKADCRKFGYSSLYLCTEHIGYYEKLGFSYVAQGYHPWGEESRIYQIKV